MIEPDEQRHILARLNAARPSRRSSAPSTSARSASGSKAPRAPSPSSTAVLGAAADAGLAEVVMGMAHRGRLNVLVNIVGKTYGERCSTSSRADRSPR
ncbi:MAG: hypothetical protein R2695_01300 [Acidimicrobiales bacterium]